MTSSAESEAPNAQSIWLYLGISLALLFGGMLLMPGARSLSYPSDDALVHIALARNLVEQGFIGSPSERLPVRDHGGWILLLALFGSVGIPWERTAAAATLLSAVLSIIAIFRVARSSGASGAVLGWLAPAAVVASGGITGLLTGSSESLALALVAFGLASAISAIRKGQLPPLSSAWWIGASACIHVEYALFWIAFSLFSLFGPSDEDSPSFVERLLPTLVRLLNGVIATAILLAPFLWWNTVAVGVPIPPAPDAPMTLTSLASGQSFAGAIIEGFRESIRAVLRTALGKFGVVGLLFGVISAVAFRSKQGGLAFPIVSWLLLLMLFCAAILCPVVYPVSGGSVMLVVKMATLLALLFAIGLFITGASKWLKILSEEKANLAPRTIEISALLLLGAIALLSAANGVVRTEWRPARESAKKQSVAREALVAQMPDKGAVQGAIATDAPGLILMRGYKTVIDLTGRLHPVLLNWISPRGVHDVEGVHAYLGHRQTDVGAFLNYSSAEKYRDLFECPEAEPGPPLVCRFRPGAVP